MRNRLLAVLVAVAVLFTGGIAAAAWLSTGIGSGSAAAGTLNAGNAPSATGTTVGNVTLTWAMSTLDNGTPATSYTLSRYAGAGDASPAATIACPDNQVGGTVTCVDTGATAGTWHYSVTPHYAGWTGAESGRTAVTVDSPPPPPTATLTLNPTTVLNDGNGQTTGSVTNFDAGETITFRLDANDGPEVGTATLDGAGAGSGTITIPAGTPAGSHTIYAKGATDEASASLTVTAPAPPAVPSFVVSAASPQTAGTAFNVTLTAKLDGVTDANYDGAKNIEFTGPANAPDGTAPSYPATVTFTDGVGTASVTLFKAETVTLVATDEDEAARAGSRTGLVVSAAAPSRLVFTSSSHDCSSGAVFLNANGATWTSKVSRSDAYGNLTSSGSSVTVSVTKPAGAGGSGPTTPLTIAANQVESGTGTSYTIQAGQPPAVDITASATGYASTTCAVDR